jgi:hypothetical protein
MKPVSALYLLLIWLSVIGFSSFSAKGADYGDIIKKTEEYKKSRRARMTMMITIMIVITTITPLPITTQPTHLPR